ncbi:helix-turn-helix domain-containing protein [Singulisphaera rosea]
MEDTPTDINRRIADRVRELRAGLALSLEGLSERSGVSRSMLSLIERGESSPTAVVLEKVASALGVTLALFFDRGAESTGDVSCPLVRREDQPVWQDPESGYVRRNVSPPGIPQPMRIVEVRFPPGGRVAFETSVRDRRVFQQVWLLDGTIEVTIGEERHQLRPGDCLAMELDRPTMFFNPSRKAARYAVVVVEEPLPKR